MKQTRADTWVALLQALVLHVLLFALMFAGLFWSQRHVAEAAQGDPIEADLVAVSDLSASMQRALQRAPKEQPPAPQPEPKQPEPLPEPVPDEVPPPPQPKELPPPVPEPAPVEQEKVQRDAPSPQVAKVPREQEQKRRQPDQTELDAKKQADRQAEDERRKQQQIAELRKQREQAARERTMAEQRAQQLADARTPGTSAATPPPGNHGTDPGLQAKYATAIQLAILRQWVRPETVPLGQRCRISIRQLPGGEVVDVTVSPSCPYDALGRQSVERAVLKASPLPYAGFEAVFNRNLDLNFVPEDR